MIDVDMNMSVKYDYLSAQVVKATNQVNSPISNGSYIEFNYNNDFTKLKDFMNNITYYYFNNYGQCIQKIDGDGNAISMQYGKVSEDATKQVLYDVSPVIYNIRNEIINHSFDATVQPISSSSGWKTDTISAVKVVDGGVYGDKCLRVRKTSSGTVKVYQTFKPSSNNFDIAFFAKSNNAIGNSKVKLVITYAEFNQFSPGDLNSPVTINKESANIVGTNEWKRFIINNLNIPALSVILSMEINIVCEHTTGDVFFDDFQMNSPHRTSYNLIQNGYFDNEDCDLPIGWTQGNFGAQDKLIYSSFIAPFDKILGSNNLMMVGDSSKYKTLSTYLAISGGSGEEFTLVAWVKGYSTHNDEFHVKVTTHHFENLSEAFYFDFSSATIDWQMLLRNITTSKPYYGITISLEHKGPNNVYFDSIQLYKEASGKHYAYDEKGNLLDQIGSEKTKSSLTYDSTNRITQSIDASGDMYNYIYNSSGLKLLLMYWVEVKKM